MAWDVGHRRTVRAAAAGASLAQAHRGGVHVHDPGDDDPREQVRAEEPDLVARAHERVEALPLGGREELVGRRGGIGHGPEDLHVQHHSTVDA